MLTSLHLENRQGIVREESKKEQEEENLEMIQEDGYITEGSRQDVSDRGVSNQGGISPA